MANPTEEMPSHVVAALNNLETEFRQGKSDILKRKKQIVELVSSIAMPILLIDNIIGDCHF